MKTFSIDSGGLKSFILNGSEVISTPGLCLIEIDGKKVGPPSRATLVSPTVVCHVYGDQSVTYSYSMVNGILLIDITIQNATDTPLANPVFSRPALNFTPTITNDYQLGEPYIRANNMGAPNFKHPTHAFYSFNAALGSCLHVSSHFRKQTLVDYNQLYINDTVPTRGAQGGGTLEIKVAWNITSEVAMADLFGAYKSDYDAKTGPTKIPADNRVCFQAYVSTDPTLVGPGNPYGYQGFRLDTADGVNQLIQALSSCIVGELVKTQGVFIVDPQGVSIRGQEIRSEWLDTLPPETAANLPALFKWGKANGVGIGIGVRPSAVIVPASSSADQSWLISPDQFPYMGNRINNAVRAGVTGPHYLDDGPYDLAATDVISYVCDTLGRATKTYTEAWNALSIAKAGAYIQKGNTGETWSAYSLTDTRLARFLQPNLNVVCLGVGVPMADHVEACKSFGIAPLFNVGSASSVMPMLLD